MPTTRKRKKPGPKSVLRIVPDELRKRRLAAGLLVPQLAGFAGITPKRVYQLEAGEKPGISIKTAKALAMHLDCRFSDITEVVSERKAS